MRWISLSAMLMAPMVMAQFNAVNLEQNLKAIECDSVLVVKSDAIRDPIHWSPDSKSIGVKLDGAWVAIELDSLMLKRFKWRNHQNIAMVTSKKAPSPLSPWAVANWTSAVEEQSRRVRTLSGTVIEFVFLDDGSLSLRVTQGLGPSREIWQTRGEDCQGLVLSPDQRWVAFICGLHGAVVMKVP